MVTMTARRLTMRELRDNVPGYAYVDAVAVEGAETVVTLCYPGRELIEVAMPWSLDDADTPPVPLEHVLAVHVFNVFGIDCVAIGTPNGGPRRVSISLEQSVALAAAGVHTVFLTRDPAHLSVANKRRRP